MNETTWIISPNWMMWFFIATASLSLLAIAIRVCIPRKHELSPSQNRAEVVAWIAISIAVFSALCVCFKFKDITKTGDGVLVTSLGVLVTLLVGWQIWQTLITKHDVEQVTTAAKQMEELRIQLFHAKEIAEAHAWSAEATRIFNNPLQAHIAFQTYIEALRHYIRGNAEYSKWIHQTLMRLSALITNHAPTSEHWAVVNTQSVDDNLDALSAEIITMREHIEEAKIEITRIKELIRAYRTTASTPLPTPPNTNSTKQ